MRLPINLSLYPPRDFRAMPDFVRQVISLLQRISQQVNQLSEGYVEAVTNAYTAAPTTGTWSQGDFIRNSAPTELGSASSMYVITGWVCVASGEPGTWRECRSLTGN